MVLKGDFGLFGDVGWCGWVLGGLEWPFGGFSHAQTSKEILQENLQEDIGDLQEDVESSFEGFEGVRVGGKGR